jgi:hypothetical protein
MAEVNVNWDRLFPGSGLVVQPQRWNAFERKLRQLTRTGVVNWAVAALAGGTWDDPNEVAGATEETLRAAYEGPLSAAWIALTPQVQAAIDVEVTRFLGGNPATDAAGVYRDGYSGAAAAVQEGQWAADPDLTVFLP